MFSIATQKTKLNNQIVTTDDHNHESALPSSYCD